MVNARNNHGSALRRIHPPVATGRMTLAWLSFSKLPGRTKRKIQGLSESTVGYPISPIRPIPPHHLIYEPLIKVATSLSPTRYQPIIRPENRGIKPITNRHRPKIFIIGARDPVTHPQDRYGTCSCKLTSSRFKSIHPIPGYSSLLHPIPAFLTPPGGTDCGVMRSPARKDQKYECLFIPISSVHGVQASPT